MTSLGEEFPKELARCRALLRQYVEIGAIGSFGHMVISAVIQRAEQAAAEGDTVAMIHLFQEMRGLK